MRVPWGSLPGLTIPPARIMYANPLGLLGLAALLAFAAPTPAAGTALLPQTSDSTAYDRWYRSLRRPEADPERGVVVTDLALTQDAGRFHFAEGSLHLLREAAGRTWGAVFSGAGTFSLTPPIPVEREQLRRHFGADSVAYPFTVAVLVFSGPPPAPLDTLPWGTLAPPRGTEELLREAMDYLTDDEGWVSRDLLTPLLNRAPGYFHAFVAKDMGDPRFLQVSPYEYEEVTLYRRADGKGRRREEVSRFHKASDYATGSSLPQEALDLVRVPAYDIYIEVADNLDLTGRATASVATAQARHPWVPFSLHPDLSVDSVVAFDGSRVPFGRGRSSADVWVDLSRYDAEARDLVFHYRGDIMDQPRRLWVELKTYTAWYPHHEFDRPATYRLTFVTPEKYRVGTVGELVSESVEGKRATRVWQASQVRQVGFNIGEFEDHPVQSPVGPPLRVHVSERAHAELNDLAYRAGYLLGEQKDMGTVVGEDLSRAFAFFGQAFGPTPTTDFLATEIPYGHGQAFPGMVLLSWSTFQKTDREGSDELFRAHEVSHQWWGVGVRPATYHDQWLAEGFSEFSGIWYMARARGSLDLYEKRLEELRQALLKRREKAPPLWLGYRTGSSRYPEDYQSVIYGKGAWVLHMLRQLLIDHDGGSEDTFERIMQDFYSRHAGGAATTEQFRAVVEEHVGDSMEWFFRQWVYGSAIPTYTFSHRLEKQPDGSYRVWVRVRQEQVPEDFQMVVPIHLVFGAQGDAVVRILVRGPLTEVELPVLPMEPTAVEFNPFEAVLADVRTEKWKG